MHRLGKRGGHSDYSQVASHAFMEKLNLFKKFLSFKIIMFSVNPFILTHQVLGISISSARLQTAIITIKTCVRPFLLF